MAHHKSALKRIRQSDKKRIYNRQNRKVLKFTIRALKEATSSEQAIERLNKAFRVLDMAASKGIIHKNKAANSKSKLSKFVKNLQTA